MPVYVKSPEMVLRELGAGRVSSRSGFIPYETFKEWVVSMRRTCRSENFTTYYEVATKDGEDFLNRWCDNFFDPKNIIKLEDIDDARKVFKNLVEQAKVKGLANVNPTVVGRVRRRPRIDGFPGLDAKMTKKVLKYVTPVGLPPFDLAVYSISNEEALSPSCKVEFVSSRAMIEVYTPEGGWDWKRPLTIHNNSNGHFPVKVFSFYESLVYLIAHGVRHVWQSKHCRGRRVWGAKGQFSDRDACAYGLHMLRCWRRGDERNGRQTRAILRKRKEVPVQGGGESPSVP